ncbi:hypothetical protein [Nostoc sp. PCC 9305]|uniref:hypothetical protein n=1 Tax=Nostoc sp. PCC 9305 TaxID=296636 RepID=UPI0039C6F924
MTQAVVAARASKIAPSLFPQVTPSTFSWFDAQVHLQYAPEEFECAVALGYEK